MGEAWDFIAHHVKKSIIEDDKKEKILIQLNETDEGMYDLVFNFEGADINFQEDYFNRRHKALMKDEFWHQDDRIFDEPNEDLCGDDREIIYNINEDDEKLD